MKMIQLPGTVNFDDLVDLKKDKIQLIARLLREQLTIESINGRLPFVEWWQSGSGEILHVSDTQEPLSYIHGLLEGKDYAQLAGLIAPEERSTFLDWVHHPSDHGSCFHVNRVKRRGTIPGEEEYREAFFQATPIFSADGSPLGYWFRAFSLSQKLPGHSDTFRGQLQMISGLFNAIPLGVLVLDSRNKILLMNHHLRNLLGLSKAPLWEMVLAEFVDFPTKKKLSEWNKNHGGLEAAEPFPCLLRGDQGAPVVALLTPFQVRQPGTESALAVLVSEADGDSQVHHHKEVLVAQLHNLYENMSEFFRLYTSQLSWKKPFDSPDYELTGKERRVIKLALEGLSNREISQELNIADVTVRKHLTHIYRKLGVQNRYELILKFR